MYQFDVFYEINFLVFTAQARTPTKKTGRTRARRAPSNLNRINIRKTSAEPSSHTPSTVPLSPPFLRRPLLSHMYGQPPRSRPYGGGRGRGQPPPPPPQHQQQVQRQPTPMPNPLLQNPNFYFQNPALQLIHQSMAIANQIPSYPMQNAAFPVQNPSFPQPQQLPSVAPRPQVRPQVPSRKELVERTERAVTKAWRELVGAGESVSAWKVSQAALLALRVDSWSSLGFQMQEVPALHRLMSTEGKVM